MRYYELLYIVNPNFEDDKAKNIIDEIGSEIEKHGVSIINHQVWGKKRLAYPIKKNKYGIYILLHFSAEKFDFLIEFERFLILNKAVIRHQVVKLDAEPTKLEEVKLDAEPTKLEEVKLDEKEVEVGVEKEKNEISDDENKDDLKEEKDEVVSDSVEKDEPESEAEPKKEDK